MESLTLKQAQNLIGKPLNVWGDTISAEDAATMEDLESFVAVYLAVDSNEVYIKGDTVFYDEYA